MELVEVGNPQSFNRSAADSEPDSLRGFVNAVGTNRLDEAQLENRWEKAGYVHLSDRIGHRPREDIRVAKEPGPFIITVKVGVISAGSTTAEASVAIAGTVSASLSFLGSWRGRTASATGSLTVAAGIRTAC